MGYQHMAVIFLDILGSRNTTGFKSKHDIHQLFHNEVRLNEKRQKSLSHVIYDRKIVSFSDCAYIFYYYKDGIAADRKVDENLIYIATYNTSLSVLKFLSKGYLVRGGISFGEAYIDDLGFFGPAVEKAYEVESKLARYPRLMFDRETGHRVFSWEHDMEKDPNLLALYRETPFLTESDGDAYFANVFYDLEKNEHLTLEDCTLDLGSVKRAIVERVSIDRAENINDDKVLEKLDWIEAYALSKEIRLDPQKAKTIFNLVPRR